MSERSLARRWSYAVSRIAARLVGVTCFSLRCSGREHWPPRGGGLVCANHQSYFDPVIVGLACDRRLNYLARETLFRFAPFRWLIHWYDAIPIRREGLGLEGIKETMRRVKHGELVLMFPEGTRSRDGAMGTIQPGFCAIARRVRAPLIPVGVEGAFDVWPRWRPWPNLATVSVHVGKPLTPDEIQDWNDEQLIAELTRRMAECQRTAALAVPDHQLRLRRRQTRQQSRPPSMSTPPPVAQPAPAATPASGGTPNEHRAGANAGK